MANPSPNHMRRARLARRGAARALSAQRAVRGCKAHAGSNAGRKADGRSRCRLEMQVGVLAGEPGPRHAGGPSAVRALFERAGHSLATRLRPSYRSSLRATFAVRISEPPSMLPHSSQKVTLARCCSSCASSTARTSCGRMCVCM
jgi:hypothetical protein